MKQLSGKMQALILANDEAINAGDTNTLVVGLSELP